MNRTRRLLATAGFAAVASAALALAPAAGQMGPGMGPGQHPTMDHKAAPGTGMPGHHGPAAGNSAPTMPGQDAFGTVQEIVRILEADPRTDWSKVNLAALREHLVDMNEVTLHADAKETPVDGGLEIAVTGSGRTLAAIQRMITAHAHEIDGLEGWKAGAKPLSDGVLLTVTSSDPKEAQHIRGLGFIGLLVSGSHHQAHHLAIAKGEMPH